MKPGKNKTLWKRENSKTQPHTEFDQVVHALTSYSDSAPKGNLNELLSVLKEDCTDSTGKTNELLGAVQNLLENLKLEIIDAHSEIDEILRDVAALLRETRTKAALERQYARLDELLERLDFVASGGTDTEVPRVEEAAPSKPATFLPKLPIARPKNFEDPSIANHLERIQSLSAILSTRFCKHGVTSKQLELQVEQLQLAEYCLRTVKHGTTIALKDVACELTEEISRFFEGKVNNLGEFVHFVATGGVVYRSFAQVFRRQLLDLAIIIGGELASRSDARIQIATHSSNSDISLTIEFSGLRTAFDLILQRMEELSATLEDFPVYEPNVLAEEKLSKTAKTRKERIAYGLVRIRRFVDCAQGQMSISSSEEQQLTVDMKFPLQARVLHILPIIVGADTFLLESHLLAGFIDSTKVCWDESQSSIEYADRSYQYCVIDHDIRPFKPNKDNPTWVLLLDTMDRKLALEVENIGEPELQVSVPSNSKIQHGHQLLGGNAPRLLIDPMDLRPPSRIDVMTDEVPTAHFLCFLVSKTLQAKIERCIDTGPIIMRNTSSLADTISQLQEYRPDFLIIEESTDEFRAMDALKRIGNAIHYLRIKVVLFIEAQTKPVEQLKKVSLDIVYLSKDDDFRELKNVFSANRDSAKSVEELERG